VARTQADDFGDKQQRILDKAAEVFAVKGFEVATTIDIAKACGMSKSALYHYHKSKEAILYTLLIAHLTEVVQQVQAAVDGRTGPEERLRAFLSSLLESNAVSRNKNIVLLNETGGLPPDQQREVRRLEKKLVQFGTELLKPLNPAVMARRELRTPYTMFLFGLVNWTYTWYDPKGPLSPAEIAARIVELFLRGYPNASAATRTSGSPKLRQIVGGRT
jgi:AcrR family transcriptional regulator